MLQQKFMDTTIKPARGCINPDEVFLSKQNLYILEKKTQAVSGSTDEKLQTALFKLEHYKNLYPKHKTTYIYCLDVWFKYNCPTEIDYLIKNDIPVFWFSDQDWGLRLSQLFNR